MSHPGISSGGSGLLSAFGASQGVSCVWPGGGQPPPGQTEIVRAASRLAGSCVVFGEGAARRSLAKHY